MKPDDFHSGNEVLEQIQLVMHVRTRAQLGFSTALGVYNSLGSNFSIKPHPNHR